MTKFKTVITTVGAAKIAAVLAGTGSIVLDGNARMAVGDGNGTLPTPVPSQTALVHEVHRAALNSASIDARDPKNIIAELVIPPGIGGFWTREMALYDAAGTLLAVGNMAEAYKPSLSEGAGRQQVIRMVIAVSDVSAVTISIDSSTVMATKEYVDESIDKHEKSRKHPDATLTEKGFTQLNSDTNSASETQAATPKAVKTVMDATNLKAPLNSPTLTGIPQAPTAPPGTNNQQLANTAFVRAAITALINASPGLLDTLGELAAALGNDANFATTMANALAGKQPLDATLNNLSGKTVAGLLQYLGLINAPKAIIYTPDVILDLNLPPKNRTGFAYGTAKNSPGFSATVLTVDSIEGSYDIQIAIGYNPMKFAFRAYNGDANVWLEWFVLGDAAARNAVGPVLHDAGVSSGAIIERGSNSNGEYVKFADGTLICWFSPSTAVTTDVPSGGATNLYFSSAAPFTFPATFVGNKPTVTPSAPLSVGSTSSWPSIRGSSLTGVSLALISNAPNTAAYLGYSAIGRWF